MDKSRRYFHQASAAAIVSIKDFFDACHKRDEEKFLYNRDAFSGRYDVDSTALAESCSTPYEYWRKIQGFSAKEIAHHLQSPYEAYKQIEEGDDKPSSVFILKFCAFMGIHPVDLIMLDHYDDAIDSALLSIVIDFYSRHETTDALNQSKLYEMEKALRNEADPYSSYDIFQQEYHAPEQPKELKVFIEKLLVNDGNPLFSPLEMVEDENEKLRKEFERAKLNLARACQSLVITRQEVNDRGKSIFGTAWKTHKRLINTCYEDVGQTWTEEFFMNDLPRVKSNDKMDARVKELWGLYLSEKTMNERSNVAANNLQLVMDRRKAFDNFYDRYEQTLCAYENRQTIMQLLPKMVDDELGHKKHVRYITPVIKWSKDSLMQKPIILLPPPLSQSAPSQRRPIL